MRKKSSDIILKMIKKIYLFLASVILLVLLVGSVSAGLCKGDNGYYIDCSKKSSAPFDHKYKGPSGKSSASYYYGNNNSDNQVKKPIFKGSYGNYRYKMYESGDDRPALFFKNYGYSNMYPSFFGGFGGLGYGGGFGYNRLGYTNRLGGYPFFGGGFNRFGGGFGGFGGNYYGNYGSYSNSYYPAYYSVGSFHAWF